MGRTHIITSFLRSISMSFTFDNNLVSVIVCEVPRLASEKLRAFCREHLESTCPYYVSRYVQHDSKPVSLLTYYKNLLIQMENDSRDGCWSGFFFICEHDCLYDRSYFDVDWPASPITYPSRAASLSVDGFFVRRPFVTSGLFGSAPFLCHAIEGKLKEHKEKGRCVWSEPCSDHTGNMNELVTQRSTKVPHIDIRHGKNFTGNRIGKSYFQTLNGWDLSASQMWAAISD